MATQSTVAGQDKEFENSEAGINNASGTGSGPATKGSAATSSALARRATGPRTKEGKERSKHNALKHGIVAKVVLLSGEPRKDFDSLLNGFRSDLRAVGQLEEFLVDKLALLVWRYRRMLIAEQAEIQRGTEYLWWDELLRRDQEATVFLKGQNAGKVVPGLILGKQNPLILAMCVELLQALKRFIEWRGFNEEKDFGILRRAYGDSVLTATTYLSLPTYYAECLLGSRLTEQERLKKGCPTPEECKANFLEELEKQIKRFEGNAEKIATVTDQKEQLEATCRNVPEGPKLDRLLRYEASLERSFDRTLSQLERLQRMRLGQPVAPELKVRHSLS
jgi:hypothetical protein